MMKVGEVFLPDDEDFKQFKIDCTTDQGWTICYDKSGCRVAMKKNSSSAFDVIRVNPLLDKTENFIHLFCFSLKVRSEFPDISAELLYDVVHDGQYRSTWDTAMLECYELCSVLPNSDIGYYSGRLNLFEIHFYSRGDFLVKSPPPFKNRDFVTQRCWLDFGGNSEKYIINHSVNHLVCFFLID